MRRTKYEIVRDVVEQQQFTKIKMWVGAKAKLVILDMTTANAILRLFVNAPIGNIEKINALPWDRLCNLAWGVTK